MKQGTDFRPKGELHVIRPLRLTDNMKTDTWRISTPDGDHIADVPWSVARNFWLGNMPLKKLEKLAGVRIMNNGSATRASK